MAKIDTQFASVLEGFKDHKVQMGTMWVADDMMEGMKLRRKKAGQAKHKIWYLQIGEEGQAPAVFYGHKFTDCLNQALEWRGLPTKSRRGPKASNGQHASA